MKTVITNDVVALLGLVVVAASGLTYESDGILSAAGDAHFNTTDYQWLPDQNQGNNTNGVYNENSTHTSIMGNSVATLEQMRLYISEKNPDTFYTYGDLATMYYAEAMAEGVRADIALAQACLETGFFKFGNDVSAAQNNFCGLGAVGGGATGYSFSTPLLGVRAHIQHLKAYASFNDLNRDCIDPRFNYVSRGSAPYVEWLGQKENPWGIGWAMSENYGSAIKACLNDMIKIQVAD